MPGGQEMAISKASHLAKGSESEVRALEGPAESLAHFLLHILSSLACLA